ncbi:MAG: VWA domain-containing protein, partial [Pyrinomonadaceae bacterium]
MLYRSPAPARQLWRASLRFPTRLTRLLSGALLLAVCAAVSFAQGPDEREFGAAAGGEIVVKNFSGRVTIVAEAAGDETQPKKIALRAESPGGALLGEKDVVVKAEGGRVEVEVQRASGDATERRVDLTLRVPARSRLRVETDDGAVDVSGPLAEVFVKTGTGTIRADVPTDSLTYSFRWTASRPRFYSETELGEVKERAGGRFEIKGRLGEKKAPREARVRLDLETERGVVLFGVEAAQTPADLRERKLTEAARAIIRSGNEEMIDAIRKIVPRFVGEYAATLPPRRTAPQLNAFRRPDDPATPDSSAVTTTGAQLVRVNASVTDLQGRAIHGLKADDFNVFENGAPRPVSEVAPTRAPFNLVLLLDVSGSVEERLDFVRKAALDFLNTVSPQDRIAIISFRDDVQLISDFTTDRTLLAERVKDIEAGGATALHDAVAYTLVHTLQPLRGERAAVVIISDGDDNRSFVPFASVLGAVIESGALIYPLYVPSGLAPAGSAPDAATTVDPTRARYLTLTSRAAEEGRQLAELSGGVYYHVTRLDELQRAYDDVVAQLRTSYTISYTSDAAAATPARHVRVRLARRQDAAIRLSPAVGVAAA